MLLVACSSKMTAARQQLLPRRSAKSARRPHSFQKKRETHTQQALSVSLEEVEWHKKQHHNPAAISLQLTQLACLMRYRMRGLEWGENSPGALADFARPDSRRMKMFWWFAENHRSGIPHTELIFQTRHLRKNIISWNDQYESSRWVRFAGSLSAVQDQETGGRTLCGERNLAGPLEPAVSSYSALFFEADGSWVSIVLGDEE